MLVIREPIWNGGNPAISVRVDRVRTNPTIRISYQDIMGNTVHPGRFRLPKNIRDYPIKQYRWGKAYLIPVMNLRKI